MTEEELNQYLDNISKIRSKRRGDESSEPHNERAPTL